MNDYTLKADFLEANAGQPLTVEYLEKLFDWAKNKRIMPSVVADQAQADNMNEQERLISEEFGTTPHKWEVGMRYYPMIGNNKRFIDLASKHPNVFIMKDVYSK